MSGLVTSLHLFLTKKWLFLGVGIVGCGEGCKLGWEMCRPNQRQRSKDRDTRFMIQPGVTIPHTSDTSNLDLHHLANLGVPLAPKSPKSKLNHIVHPASYEEAIGRTEIYRTSAEYFFA